mmetsp:Transcript_21185/g.44158  ORF Transcript_21185/g.44158 Transcript_21185/m.44158 type:complete len:272 (+) Transcript_21185:2067-2882(+)
MIRSALWHQTALHPHSLHLHRALEQVIEALALRLSLFPAVSPYVYTVPPYQHGIALGILQNSLLQLFREQILRGTIVDDGYLEHRIIRVISHPLEHFQMSHAEHFALFGGVQQRRHHGVHRMRVDHAPDRRLEFVHHVPKGSARAQSHVGSLGRDHHVAIHVQFEDVVSHKVLLLHSAWRYEYPVRSILLRAADAYAHAASGAGGPSRSEETFAELRDEGADGLAFFDEASRHEGGAACRFGVDRIHFGGTRADAAPGGLEVDPSSMVVVE